MRCYFSGTAKDGAGKVIPSATISVFTAPGVTTPASIYTTLTGATAVNSVTADTTGFFYFYIDRFDYDMEQKFTIQIAKSGFTSQSYLYQNIDSVVLGTYTISDDKTVSTHLVVPKGVIYSVATGKVLTFTGAFEAGPYTIFAGLGTVAFGLNALQGPADPKWWAATIETGYIKQWTYQGTLADDATVTLPTTTAGGWGYAQEGDNENYGFFCFTSASVVTLMANSTNCVNTNTDVKFCIYDGGANVIVANRVGSSKAVKIQIFYL